MKKDGIATGNRILALLLSALMILSMIPVGLVAATETHYGTVESLSGEPAITGSDKMTVTYADITLDWVDADASINREQSGWYLGLRLKAPEGMTGKDDFVNEDGKESKLKLKTIDKWTELSFWGSQDSDPTAQDAERYIDLWYYLDEVRVIDNVDQDGFLRYYVNADWDKDGEYEQEITIAIDTSKLTLTKKNAIVYPLTGSAKVSILNSDGTINDSGTITGNESNHVRVTPAATVYEWFQKDTALGRNVDGWWAGIRIDFPESMTEEQLQNAKYRLGEATGSVWDAREGASDDPYITLWKCLNDLAENKSLSTARMEFDWDNDGIFEQKVDLSINPANVTLLDKDGSQAYPLYTVSVTENENCTVTINKEETNSLKVKKGTEVTVVITAKDGYRISEIAGVDDNSIKYNENKSEATVTLKPEKDVSISVTFEQSYLVKLTVSENGEVSVQGNKPSQAGSVEVPNSGLEDGKIKVVATPSKGYTVTTFDIKNEEVTDLPELPKAENEPYRVDLEPKNYTIEVAFTDTTAPTVTDVAVSDSDKWASKKTISFQTSDSAEGECTAYLSETETLDTDSAKKIELTPTSEGASSYSGEYTVTGEFAEKSFYLFVLDAAGNSYSQEIKVQKVDSVEPEIGNVQVNYEKNADGTESVTYCFTAADNCSEIAKVTFGDEKLTAEHGVYSITVNDTSMHTIAVYDNAGNVSKKTASNAAPVISDIVLPESWVKDSTVITFKVSSAKKVQFGETALEAADGIYSSEVKKDGAYTITATDEDGNTSTVAVELTNKIDTEAPEVESADKSVTAEWTNSGLTISGKVSDGQSGVKEVRYATTKPSELLVEGIAATLDLDNDSYFFNAPEKDDGGNYKEFNGTYYIWAVDNVGHTSEVKEIRVSVDRTAPEIIDVSYVQDADKGFVKEVINVLTFGLVFKEKVYISVEANDSREGKDSGIAKYQYQLVKDGGELTEDGWTDYAPTGSKVEEIELDVTNYKDFVGKVYVRVYDVAGNVTEATSDTKTGTLIVVEHSAPKAPTVVAVTNDNKAYTGSWTNQDVIITLSGGDTVSGVDVYQYIAMDKAIDMEEFDWDTVKDEWVNTTSSKLTISADTNAVYYFRAVSNAGHEGTVSKGKTVKVQKSAPKNATVEIAKPDGKNNWYVNNPTITIKPPVITNTAPVTTYYKLWKNGTSEPEGTELGDANQPSIKSDGDGDGVYNLKVWTKDVTGNLSTVSSQKIYVDTTAPTDLNIEIEGESIKSDGKTIAFEVYCQEAVTVTLSADCDVSGLSKLEYVKKTKVTETVSEEDTWIEYDAATGISVEMDERCIIYFRAVDNAGNVSDYIWSKGIVVDNTKPEGDTEAPEIDIALSVEDEEDICNDIYRDDITVGIMVLDPRMLSGENNINGVFSGLKQVSYDISYIDENGNIHGEGKVFAFEPNNVTYDSDTNLIEQFADSFTIKADEFNSNQVTISITAVDNAGNERTSAEVIAIDTERPEVTVTFTDDGKGEDGYYATDRVATIKVTDRNFAADKVKITALKDGKSYSPQIGAWSSNGNTHTATITFSGAGKYTEIKVSCTDKAGWTTLYEDPNEFTIDMTAPTVTVTYDNNSADNEKFFDAVRTATVTIVEENFDKNLVNIKINTDRGGEDPEIVWSNNGSIHVAKIYYTADGDYTFDISVEDMARNINKTVDYRDSVAPQDFVIDTVADMITIDGVDNGKAYGYEDSVIPSLTINDINLLDYTIWLVGTQKGSVINLSEEVANLINDGKETVTGIFDLFAVSQELDGIYTLTVTAVDKAGNEDFKEIVFTVNRFGSVYVYNDYLLSLIADGGVYAQSITDDLEITEYNADKLLSGSLSIEITCDGRPLENVIYEVTPEINDTVSVGESGWYQYKYIISKDNFTADGVYKISVSSKDATGNTPENSNYEDMGIAFQVDSTVPEINNITGLEEAIINDVKADVRYTVFDAMGLKSVQIYVDDSLVAEITEFGTDHNNYSGSFTLSEQSYTQHIRFVVTDLAGNVTDTDSEEFTSTYEFHKDVTVSTNFFIRWYANKGLFWGTVGGVAVLAIGIAALLAAKRKKVQA